MHSKRVMRGVSLCSSVNALRFIAKEKSVHDSMDALWLQIDNFGLQPAGEQELQAGKEAGLLLFLRNKLDCRWVNGFRGFK